MFHIDVSGSENPLQFGRCDILDRTFKSSGAFNFEKVKYFAFHGNDIDLSETAVVVPADNGETLFAEKFTGAFFRNIPGCSAHRTLLNRNNIDFDRLESCRQDQFITSVAE